MDARQIHEMPRTPEFSIELNPQQRAAVEHGDGPLLVVAGAGTGKTRVITERIRYLLDSRPDLAAENILGLTFTDKAAGEMLYRLKKTVGERAEGVWLSTFHKFCIEKVLKEVNPEIRTLEEIDHWILLRRHMRELGLKHFKRLAEPGQFLNDFVKFFSRCQDELVSPEDYEAYVRGLRAGFEAGRKELEPDAREAAEEEVEKQEEVARAFRVSERLLREGGFVTFGGQLLQTVAALRSDPERLAAIRRQYRHILVDEFQDTNIAQIELLWLLAGEHRNIVAVGDDDQAIYRFRGASFGSFTIFLERFCDAAAPSDKRWLAPLERNYRSTHRILRVAGHVISHNERSPLLPAKQLTTENPEGEKIRIAEFARPEEEAFWVATEIERLHRAGRAWRDFGVLYRKHTHRNALVETLRRKRIPFVIRNLTILTSTLVRDLIAYLRLVAVPSDNVACARVLAAPAWGLDPRDLVRLAERAGRGKHQSVYDALENWQHELPFDGSRAQPGELIALLEKLRRLARRASATQVFDELVAQLGLAPLASDADRRNLERFARFLSEWERDSEGKSLRDFIEYFEYFREAGGQIELEEEPAEDAVQLMTVHAAKGLEFGHVFVLQVSNGDFPVRPQAPLLEFPAELMKEERPRGDFRIQEERRLFYVALTRARRQLTLSAIVNKRKKPSPFLEDILREPRIQRSDAQQLAPEVALPPAEEAAGSAPADPAQAQLFGPVPERTRAYSQVALWAKAYHPPLPEPLQLSASAIENYLNCPMKYLFEKVWGVRGGPQAAMTFGNVMHSTIREFVEELRKRREVGFEEVASIYEQEWSAAGFRDAWQEEEYRKTGRDQLEAFYGSYRAAPAELLHQEKYFELPLDPDVIVTGRMDQINLLGARGKGAEVEIVDYKTGNPKQSKQANESLQLSLYALAAQDVLELTPVRLVFYNLTTNEAVSTTRNAKALEKAKATVAEVADSIRAGSFPARPNFRCRSCDFLPLCPAHEQLISIQPARS
jgi:DNA helicase-2/ATP-dependent DNA helicase PcrA